MSVVTLTGMSTRKPITVAWDDGDLLEVIDAPYESTIDLAMVKTAGIEVDKDMIVIGIPASCVYQVTGWDPVHACLEVECWQWFPPEDAA